MRAVCTSCLAITECKHLPLYIIGSEGCCVCHQCEMDVVNYIRTSRSLAGRAQLAGYQMAKHRETAERKADGEA